MLRALKQRVSPRFSGSCGMTTRLRRQQQQEQQQGDYSHRHQQLQAEEPQQQEERAAEVTSRSIYSSGLQDEQEEQAQHDLDSEPGLDMPKRNSRSLSSSGGVAAVASSNHRSSRRSKRIKKNLSSAASAPVLDVEDEHEQQQQEEEEDTTLSVLDELPKTLRYQAPMQLEAGDVESMVRNVPARRKSDAGHEAHKEDEECAICLCPLTTQGRSATDPDRVVTLLVCSHEFHFACLQDALKHGKRCPVCRTATDRPQGTMPSGTMRVRYDPRLDCTGFSGFGSLVIDYQFSGGVQMPYHDHPGTHHDGTYRTAFLPNTPEGRALLKRFQFAFMHGLTFRVGTSLTTGRQHQITWASIHHKTSPTPGTFGFPDPGYFYNVHEELDAAGVPAAQNL